MQTGLQRLEWIVMSQRIGELLLKAGLVSNDQLETALRLQVRRGGRLGALLASLGYCDQTAVDAAWLAGVVIPPLEDAVNRVSGNRFTLHADRRIMFNRVQRRDTLLEDMMNGCAITCAQVQIEGQAVIFIGGAQCLPIDFTIDLEHGFALLDDNSESIVRRWIGIVERRQASISMGTTA